MRKTPWDIAAGWYSVAGITSAIQRAGSNEFGAWQEIPRDIMSPEFACWLTHQYRLAMAKGVQIGRGELRDD